MHARRFHFGRDRGASILDEAGLGGGATHVEGDHVLLTGHLAKEGCGEAAARRTRFQQADREGACRLRRDEAAGRVHEIERAAEAALPQLALEAAQILLHQRLHESVGASGDEALILPELGNHLARERDRELGIEGADGFCGLALMCAVAIGVQEADGDRLDAVGLELAGGFAHLVEIDRGHNLAVAVHALRDLETVAARHQRVGILQEEIVDVVALLGAHLQDVAEAGSGDQAELGAFPLDQRIGDEGRAMYDLAHLGESDAGIGDELAEALQRADRRIMRRRQAFVQQDLGALGVEQDEVGERPPDVEADAITSLGLRHVLGPCWHFLAGHLACRFMRI